MRTSLADLLATGRVLLADGATGTNHLAAGLPLGVAPETWILDHPDRVHGLHRAFVAAGADIVLTNTFGCNPIRLRRHGLQDRTYELARRAAGLARDAADGSPRPVVVAGSIGPTGERFAPFGPLTHDGAVAAFRAQVDGLRDGGADLAWIETMWAPEEVAAAVRAAVDGGLPYAATCSFDVSGSTGAGLSPRAFLDVLDGLPVAPLAVGANCGAGPVEVLASVRAMAARGRAPALIAKANAGLPRGRGGEAVYDETPDRMAAYAVAAADAGARIVGGCCGTTAGHLAAMRIALDDRPPAANGPTR